MADSDKELKSEKLHLLKKDPKDGEAVREAVLGQNGDLLVLATKKNENSNPRLLIKNKWLIWHLIFRPPLDDRIAKKSSMYLDTPAVFWQSDRPNLT